MYTHHDQRAALVAAAQNVSENAAYLMGFPTDTTAVAQLLESATTIGEIARALGLRELVDLNDRLADCAQMNLSCSEEISKLNRIASRILALARALVQDHPVSAQPARRPIPAEQLDPMFALTDTRWVTL